MPQNLLQRQDIAAIDHEMAGKCKPHHMGSLIRRQWYAGSLQAGFECRVCIGEESFVANLCRVYFVVSDERFLELCINGNGPYDYRLELSY